MLVFLILSFGYLVGWGVMFASTTFRWTFVQWRFFSLIASGSVLLTLMALILGVVCRLNFGKGLSHYRKLEALRISAELNPFVVSAQEPIPDDGIPDPYMSPTGESDPEKVDFPSHTDAIPTFSVAFGPGDDVPLPNQMFAGRQRGPRFYEEPMEPFEQQTTSYVLGGQPSHNRSQSGSSQSSERDVPHSSLTRHGTHSSQRSGSQSSRSNSKRSNSERWVIE
jgi:hypothetical protein